MDYAGRTTKHRPLPQPRRRARVNWVGMAQIGPFITSENIRVVQTAIRLWRHFRIRMPNITRAAVTAASWAAGPLRKIE